MADHLSMNRAVDDEYLAFRQQLQEVRAKTPLSSPNGYYPYASLELIPQVLPLLDRHGVDLRKHIFGKTVLDLGCGDGDLSFFFERFHPQRMIAIDWGPTNFNGMEACRVLKKALSSKVEFVDADVHSLNFSRLPMFDTAICLGFLYHSRHPLWILERLAKRSAHLFLTTKIFDNDASYAYFYDVAECNDDPTNWWCFTPKALDLMLKRAGFTVVFMERLDPYIGNSHPVDLARDGRVFVYAQTSAARPDQKREEPDTPAGSQ